MHVCDPRSDRSCKASYLGSGRAASTVLFEVNRRGNFGSGSSPSGACVQTHPRHGRETRKRRALQSPSLYVRGLLSTFQESKDTFFLPDLLLDPKVSQCILVLGMGGLFFFPLCSL